MCPRGLVCLLLLVALVASASRMPIDAADSAAESSNSGLALVVDALSRLDSAAAQRDVLKGIEDALAGRKGISAPPQWSAVATRLLECRDDEVRERTLSLSLLFGEPGAADRMRGVAAEASNGPSARQTAIYKLAQYRDPQLPPLLYRLLEEEGLRVAAVRALASYDLPDTPRILIDHYPRWSDADRQEILNTLASRVPYARALLDALANNRIPRQDLPAYIVRQLGGLKDPKINATLAEVWGTSRPTAADKAARIAKYKGLLTQAYVRTADLPRGRAMYVKTCAACHVLFGEGSRLGPELTGAQRNNVDYILENVLDPNAVVGRDFQVVQVALKDGRTVVGLVAAEDDATLTLQTTNGKVILPKSDIEDRVRSNASLMPEGLFDPLTDENVRDLVGYLGAPGQVPLPADLKPAAAQP